MPINVLQAQIQVTAPGAAQAANQVAGGLQNVQQQANRTSSSLTNLQRSVTSFGGGVRNTAGQLSGLSGNMNNLSVSAGTAGNSLRNAAAGSNQAVNSLTNLGRVVQDAPYGFLGIANNLNPLLESFQRLQASTGSTGAALRALGQQLTGPAGVGIALSVVSSLLVVFGKDLFGTSEGLKDAQRSNEEFTQSLTRLSDELDTFRGRLDFSVEIKKLDLQIRGLNGAALDVADGLNKISASRADISKTKEGIKPLIDEFNSLKFEGQRVIRVYEAIKKLRAGTATEAEKDLATRTQSNSATRIKDIDDLAIAYQQFFKTFAIGQETLNAVSKDQQVTLNRLVTLYKTLEKEKRNITQANDELAKSERQLIIDQRRAADEAPLPNIRTGISPIQQSVIPVIIEPEINPEATPEQKKALTGLFKDFSAPFNVTPVFDAELQERLKKQAEEIAKLLNAASESFLTSIGEGIGAAVSGNIKGFGQSILAAIGDLLSQLGKALIKFGIIKTGLDKIFGPAGLAIPGAVAIGLGVLAVAAGSALKNFKGFRAAGGPVTAGGSYVVGERGPELFRPNTGGSIIPNNQIGSFAGSGNFGGGTVTLRLAGNDLIAAISLNQLAQGRLT
jgi:hypothetical protein